MKKIMTICAIFLAFALIAAAIGFTLNKKPMLKITAENFEELTFNLFLVEVPTYYVMRITPDRKVIYEEYQYYPVPDELQAQSEKVLSEEKYNQLIDTLNKNSFMELPEDLSTESYDGAIIDVEVKVNGVLHKVGGLNPMGVNKRFDKVHELVNQLLEFTNTDYETIPDPYQQIGEYLRSAVKEAHIPGMAIAIVDKYNTRFSNIYGNGKSIDAPFLIGSITKSFTALAVMQLAEQGKIDLDKSVAKYLPGLGVDGRITIRQLLNQTSGFSTYQTRQSLTVTDSHNKHIYANVNYGLLGEVIEAVSGISYEEYIEENIYKPIGMNHSYTSLEDAKSGGLGIAYRLCRTGSDAQRQRGKLYRKYVYSA